VHPRGCSSSRNHGVRFHRWFPRRPGAPPPPPPTGPTWQQQVLAKGWGYAVIVPNSIQADNGAGLTQGVIGLVNKGQPRNKSDGCVYNDLASLARFTDSPQIPPNQCFPLCPSVAGPGAYSLRAIRLHSPGAPIIWLRTGTAGRLWDGLRALKRSTSMVRVDG
jgi:hypothetical protein